MDRNKEDFVNMDVSVMSTKTSTNFDEFIKKAEQSLNAAKVAGAREETIKTLEKNLKTLEDRAKNDGKYKDFTFLKEWPNDILVERYKDATRFATNLEKEIGDINLFNQKPDKAKLYAEVLRIIELLEDEGRAREILFFMSSDELMATCKSIFGEGCEWASPTTEANEGGQNI